MSYPSDFSAQANLPLGKLSEAAAAKKDKAVAKNKEGKQ